MVHELSEETSAAIGRILPRLCRAVMKASGADAYNVICNVGEPAGQVVMHVHFHVIPRNEGDAFGFNWPGGSYPPGRMEELADAVRKEL